MKYICLFLLLLTACSNNTAKNKVEKNKNKKEVVKVVSEMDNHFKTACLHEDFLMEGDLVNILKSLNIKHINIALIGADKDNCKAKIKINAKWKDGTEPYSSPLIVTLPLDRNSKEDLGLY